MKIAIVGGRTKADFLIEMLLKKNNQLIVINNDRRYCEYMAERYGIGVYFGDGSKQFVLDEAGIHGFDILIALTESDADNFNICQTAKRIFAVNKAVCTVANPKNVEVFKKLGINTVISATYMLAQFIEQVSTVEKLSNSLSLADNKIILSEVAVELDNCIVGKKIIEVGFPAGVIISCLIRDLEVIIPNGQTIILANDKLLIVSSPQNQERAINIVTEVKSA